MGYLDTQTQDRAHSHAYWLSSLPEKTEQQKFMETLLDDLGVEPSAIADIACGAGTASHHLSRKYPSARFELIDMAPDAIDLARGVMHGADARCRVGSAYAIDLANGGFDLTLCWQVLSCLDEPERAVRELVRITKPGGTILASSLFNLDFDADIRASITDRTRPTSPTYPYNTWCRASVEEWLDGLPCRFEIIPFHIGINLPRKSRGLGTFTTGEPRLQVSAGYLMNWGVLVIEKH